ncbi:two-component sensor histidine kinase [Collibacillus ludicampi]|uniref:histidine kinase n=1 Tax=Collibacillus ludicampi TaxID=2771369 RepID=A0AAV4LFQ5_9BACL|nr:ATP-binding protein [Collibacillus ludicampi]GIM46498.1 two-component sensor histidine kinase [Collibacillus ludicampi]
MDVINGINQILLQVLIILFPIIIYYFYWEDISLIENKKSIEFAYGIISGTSIILCMICSFPIYHGYLLDLRTIPLLIGFLYGGYGTGIFISVVFLSFRYFLGGGGLLVPVIVCSIVIPITFLLIPKYKSYSSRHKVITTTALTLFTSLLIASVTYLKLMWSNLPVNRDFFIFFAGFSIIQTCTMWVTVFLIESMQERVMMHYRLRQAEKLNVLSGMAASVAHEIRNPMAVVRGFMQLFNENAQIPMDIRPYLKLIIEELDRAESIITGFLTLAKPQLERLEPVSVLELIDHGVNLMSPYALLHGVEIQVFADNSPCIEADPRKFSQVLINIIKNGIEAMTDGGLLKIGVKEEGGIVLIKIIDSGIGMTKEELQRLGTLFYSTKTKGTGVGLMVSYKIIETMNGRIEVSSKKGSGTQFTIMIPKAS